MFVTPLRSVFFVNRNRVQRYDIFSICANFWRKLFINNTTKLSKIKMQNPYFQHNKNFAFSKSFPR